MAHGHIKEFDSAKETIEDFRQYFEFYCTANNVITKRYFGFSAQFATKYTWLAIMLLQHRDS